MYGRFSFLFLRRFPSEKDVFVQAHGLGAWGPGPGARTEPQSPEPGAWGPGPGAWGLGAWPGPRANSPRPRA